MWENPIMQHNEMSPVRPQVVEVCVGQRVDLAEVPAGGKHPASVCVTEPRPGQLQQ